MNEAMTYNFCGWVWGLWVHIIYLYNFNIGKKIVYESTGYSGQNIWVVF